jgi:hypothetical protein
MIFYGEQKLLSSSLRSFLHPPVASSNSGPNIHLNTFLPWTYVITNTQLNFQTNVCYDRNERTIVNSCVGNISSLLNLKNLSFYDRNKPMRHSCTNALTRCDTTACVQMAALHLNVPSTNGNVVRSIIQFNTSIRAIINGVGSAL